MDHLVGRICTSALNGYVKTGQVRAARQLTLDGMWYLGMGAVP